MAKELIYMPECHSTNDEAQKQIQQGSIREGLVIITDNQTAGRGQRGNSWVTEPHKNLTFSVILQPTFLAVSEQMFLTMAVSLGIHDWLVTRISQGLKIKWPNDVLVNDKKLCGILIENHVAGYRINQSVVGVGLNVNQQTFNYPRATSLAAVTGRSETLPDAFCELIECMEYRYLQLRNGHESQLKADYLERLYRIGEASRFLSGGKVFEGVLEGVSPEGMLEVRTPGGLRTFGFKEIEYRD